MDLRQFTTTPNNLDQSNNQDQRRTSVSSLSSYASSAYGGQTPNSARLTSSRYFGVSGGGASQPGTANGQQQQSSTPNWLSQQGMLNVTPWIEQQQQVSNSTTSIENQNFVNNYGNNLNQQNLTLHNLPPNLQNLAGNNNNNGGVSNLQNSPLYQQNNSTMTTYDPQSNRASPGSSHILPNQQQQQQQHHRVANPSVAGTAGDSKNDDSNVNKNNDDDNETTNENNVNENDGNENEKDDDELIPTAIVIKNIPFAIKKEQLLEVMTKLNLPLPYAFNYHFDNGVFRGLAFANFTSTDETTSVVNQLNGREIGGRKLRVEYKKMLPLAERERIEREKREKRGQLEEQHRSASNVSLASMISVASAPAGVNKQQQQQNQNQNQTQNQQLPPQVQQQIQQAQQLQQQQSPQQVQGQQPPGLLSASSSQQQLVTPLQAQHTGSERFYAPIPFINNLPIPPQHVDFNDPETLEYYSQLLFFRDDKDKLYNEIAYPSSLSQNHKRIISILSAFLGLVETYDQNLILVKRRTLIHDPSPLLRSQSHSAIPLLNQQSTGGANSSQRFRQQTTIPQPTSTASSNRIPPNFNLGLNNASSSALSSAALLRNNPTPTRVLPNLYNQQQPSSASSQQQQQQQPQPQSQPQQQNYFQSQPLAQSQSQPTTPGLDSMSRFAPFQQGLTGLTSLQQFQQQQAQQQQQQQQQPFGTQSHHQSQTNLQSSNNNNNQMFVDDSYGRLSSSSNSSNGGNETPGDISDSLHGLTLSLGNEAQGSNSPSIWGPRSVQPPAI